MKSFKFTLSALFFSSFFLLNVSEVKSENYLYGGPKLFYYDVTNEDLQSTANDLVALGFSTARVEGISSIGITYISQF